MTSSGQWSIITVLLWTVAAAVVVTAFEEPTAVDNPRFAPLIRKKRASDDPEIFMTAEQIVTRWGYPFEEYDVETVDGYILSLFRIPYGRNSNSSLDGQKRPIVFLQHGLESSAADWIVNLPNQAAGYVFADAGFDVWMGNFRGNTYGKRHVNLTAEQHEFWEFSWDEMAHYDLPVLIETTLNLTGESSLYYVGHSMGTQTAFAKFSTDQNLASKIKRFYAMAPVTTVKSIKGPLRSVAKLTNILRVFLSMFGVDEFLPNNLFVDQVAKYFCGNVVLDYICTNMATWIAGPDTNQMNATRMPVFLSHYPAGTSTQNIVHFGQMVTTGLYQMYDYGLTKNLKRYGQITPPLYDVSQLRVPVVLYWSNKDWLADIEDVEGLIPSLRTLVGNNHLDDFNHVDFIWGLRAAPEIYWPIVKEIRHLQNLPN